jgi:hypothetical protein
VDAQDVLWVLLAEARADAGAPVAALRPIAVVAEDAP